MVPKKNPTTYGKTVRKHAVNVDFAALESASQSDRRSGLFSHRERQISPSDLCAQHDGHTPLASLSDMSEHVAQRKSTATLRSERQTVSASSINANEFKHSHDAAHNHASSLDYFSTRKGLSGRTVKRRKLAPEVIGTTDTWQGDDGSAAKLQRSLTADCTPRNGLARSSSGVIHSANSEGKSQSRHWYATPAPHAPDHPRKNSSGPPTHNLTNQAIRTNSLCAQGTTDPNVTLSMYVNEEQGVEIYDQTLGKRSDTPLSANVLSTPMNSSKRTRIPSPPHAVAGVSDNSMTPRQRKSWRKLMTICTSPTTSDDTSLIFEEEEDMNRKPRSNTPKFSPFKSRTVDPVHSDRSIRLIDLLTLRRESDREDSSSDECGANGVLMNATSDESVGVMNIVGHTFSSADTVTEEDQIDGECSMLLRENESINAGTAPKTTYAHHRSYLTEVDMINERDLCGLVSPYLQSADKNQHSSASRKYAPSPGVDQGDNVNRGLSQAQPDIIRSAHELRKAGGNTRLISELEAILDDLEDQQTSSLATPRSCLMNLIRKLRDRSTCRLFVDKGFDARVATHISLVSDPIQKALAVTVILQIMSHFTSPVLLSCMGSAKMQAFWDGLLIHPEDLTGVAETFEIGMTKLAREEFSNACVSSLCSPIWHFGRPAILSSQILALQALDASMRQCREAGLATKMLSPKTIHIITLTATKNLNRANRDASSSIDCLKLALSILEMSTLSCSADRLIPEWGRDTHERMKALFPTLIEHLSGADLTPQMLTLRLYLNLTNNDTYLCELYSSIEIVTSLLRANVSQFMRLSQSNSSMPDPQVLDSLVLSLGCLINLAESSDRMRQSLLNIKVEDTVALEVLLRIFAMKRQQVAEVSDADLVSRLSLI